MTHKTQPTAHAEITAPISADLRRIDDAGAKSAPITLMTEDRACTWAWDQVQQDVGTKGWTAGDSCNFYGFFLWGWNYRGQHETQRYAAPPAPAAAAVLTTQQIIDRFDFLEGAVTESTYRRIVETAESIQRAALATAPAQAVPEQWIDDPHDIEQGMMLNPEWVRAQEHATQLAGQGHLLDAARDLQEMWDELAKVSRGEQVAGPSPSAMRRYDAALTAAEQAMVAAAPAQAQEDAPIVWPKSRDVGRIGDMSMTASLRVGLDGDNDTYVNVWDENGGGSIEFCTPGAGGGKSRRTRVALLALMVAMEADNAEDPRRDWWAASAAQGGA